MHGCVSSAGQAAPVPSAGVITLADRVWVPVPHVTLQVLQSDQVYTQSTLHGSSVHGCVSSTGQAAPLPFAGVITLADRVWVPLSHVTLQALQSDHV